MDSEYAAALRRILTRAMEDVRQTQAAIEAAFIMRSLERIGDHARNIARHVGFIGGHFDPDATGVLPASILRTSSFFVDSTCSTSEPLTERSRRGGVESDEAVGGHGIPAPAINGLRREVHGRGCGEPGPRHEESRNSSRSWWERDVRWKCQIGKCEIDLKVCPDNHGSRLHRVLARRRSPKRELTTRGNGSGNLVLSFRHRHAAYRGHPGEFGNRQGIA